MSSTRRTRMTRQLFRDALIELLQTKPFQKITVKEICEKADLNRTTFYLHYTDQDNLFDEIVSLFEEDLKRYFPPISDKANRLNRLKDYLEYVKRESAVFRILMIDAYSTGIREKILNDLLDDKRNDYRATGLDLRCRYVYYFILDGSISMVLHWIDNDFDLAADELAGQIDDLCYPVFEQYFC